MQLKKQLEGLEGEVGQMQGTLAVKEKGMAKQQDFIGQLQQTAQQKKQEIV